MKTFKEKEIGTELLIEVRDLIAARATSSMPPIWPWRPTSASSRASCPRRLAEPGRSGSPRSMKAIEQAPDAVRDRFAAWRKARPTPGPLRKASSRWRCRAIVAGSDAAAPI